MVIYLFRIVYYLVAGPLPWDGILTDDEDTPQTSPRLRLGSGGRKKAKAGAAADGAAVPSIPQIQEIVNTLSKSANNALGASWLDRVRQNLAEGQAAAAQLQQQQRQPEMDAAVANEHLPGGAFGEEQAGTEPGVAEQAQSAPETGELTQQLLLGGQRVWDVASIALYRVSPGVVIIKRSDGHALLNGSPLPVTPSNHSHDCIFYPLADAMEQAENSGGNSRPIAFHILWPCRLP